MANYTPLYGPVRREECYQVEEERIFQYFTSAVERIAFWDLAGRCRCFDVVKMSSAGWRKKHNLRSPG